MANCSSQGQHVCLAAFLFFFILVSVFSQALGVECEAGMSPDDCCDERTHRCSVLYEAAHDHFNIQHHSGHSQRTPPPSAGSSRTHQKRGASRLPASASVAPNRRGQGHGGQGSEAACIAHRTYLQCLRNFSCVGSIHYHAAMKGIERKMTHDNCQLTGPVFHPAPPPSSTPNQKGVSGRVTSPECSGGRGRGRGGFNTQLGYCVLYGDPHLRTLDGRYQTCAIHGAWPLIDNRHVTVQVTSDKLTDSSTSGDEVIRRASVVAKVTVLLKRHDQCADSRYVTYEASSDWLPPVFTDGRSYVNSVSIIEHEPNGYVEIRLPYCDTNIYIRQVAGYLSVAIRTPSVGGANDTSSATSSTGDESLTETPQLCVSGCPHSQLVSLSSAVKHVRLRNTGKSQGGVANYANEERDGRVTSAVEACRRAGTVDVFLDSCVFDLVATGNDAIVNASVLAMSDMLSALPSTLGQLTNRTTLQRHVTVMTSSPISSNASSTLSHVAMVIAYILLSHISIGVLTKR